MLLLHITFISLMGVSSLALLLVQAVFNTSELVFCTLLHESLFVVQLSSSLLQTNLHQMTPISLRIEELMGGKRKGIGSILDLRTEKREYLRRTFSADMSSKIWLAQNTTISSIDTSSSSDDEDEEENKDIWSSIQLQKTTNMNSPFNAPYIHPLVKRSSTSLGEKSLQICTESLGSETGSDGYSCDQNYFQSSSSEEDDDDDEEQVVRNETQSRTKDLVTVNYNCCISRRSPTCSFPPPLSSISRRDGLSVQMRPQRRDGRLIIEAVPVSSHYYLHAHRQGGRLQLSFINSPSKEVPHIPPQREETEESSKEEEEEEEEEKIIVLEVKAKQEEEMRAGHPTFLVMNKLICGMHAMRLNNPNPWMDKKMDCQDEQREREMPSSKIFNGYDRCWKLGPMSHQSAQTLPNMLMVPKKKQVMIMGEDLLPVIRRCNEPLPLRPVIVLEPFCIATT